MIFGAFAFVWLLRRFFIIVLGCCFSCSHMDDYEGFYGLSLVLLEFFLGEKFVWVLVLRTLLVLRTVALLIKFNRFKKRAYKLLAEYSATKLFFLTFLFLAEFSATKLGIFLYTFRRIYWRKFSSVNLLLCDFVADPFRQ
jgi:hypothetical protein